MQISHSNLFHSSNHRVVSKLTNLVNCPDQIAQAASLCKSQFSSKTMHLKSDSCYSVQKNGAYFIFPICQ